jgi:hypothetical protein
MWAAPVTVLRALKENFHLTSITACINITATQNIPLTLILTYEPGSAKLTETAAVHKIKDSPRAVFFI